MAWRDNQPARMLEPMRGSLGFGDREFPKNEGSPQAEGQPAQVVRHPAKLVPDWEQTRQEVTGAYQEPPLPAPEPEPAEQRPTTLVEVVEKMKADLASPEGVVEQAIAAARLLNRLADERKIEMVVSVTNVGHKIALKRPLPRVVIDWENLEV